MKADADRIDSTSYAVIFCAQALIRSLCANLAKARPDVAPVGHDLAQRKSLGISQTSSGFCVSDALVLVVRTWLGMCNSEQSF